MKKKMLLPIGGIFIVLLGALTLSYTLSSARQPVNEVLNTATFTETTDNPALAATSTLFPATLPAGVVATVDPNQKAEIILESSIPDTPEAWDVIHMVERANIIDVKAGWTLDPSEFPSVFINDPRFPVSPGVLKTVRRLSHNPSLETAGWLDYKMAMVNSTKEQRMRPKAANAIPTDTPMPTATIPPGVVYVPYGPPPPLIFQSLQVEGDIAKVVINEGATTYELTLVLIDGKWYIAAYYGISVSP